MLNHISCLSIAIKFAVNALNSCDMAQLLSSSITGEVLLSDDVKDAIKSMCKEMRIKPSLSLSSSYSTSSVAQQPTSPPQSPISPSKQQYKQITDHKYILLVSCLLEKCRSLEIGHAVLMKEVNQQTESKGKVSRSS